MNSMLKMFNIFKKEKVPIKIFIIASIVAFIIVFLLFVFLKINFNSQSNEANYNSTDKYFFNSNYQKGDPLMTKVPNLRDILAGPIINERDPYLGNLEAPIAIVYFSDYECSFCQKQEEVFSKILDTYQDRVKLIWKDFPDKNNIKSIQASIAARCAQKQNKFWQYHDLLYENNTKFSQELFLNIADSLALNSKEFNDCRQGTSVQQLIYDNILEAQALDINGVPFIYINDQEVMGQVEFDDLKKIIDIELNKLK